jgi:hypothetical protein
METAKKSRIMGILHDNAIQYEDAIKGQRGFLLKTDTLHPGIIMRLLTVGITELTAINNNGLMQFIITY